MFYFKCCCERYVSLLVVGVFVIWVVSVIVIMFVVVSLVLSMVVKGGCECFVSIFESVVFNVV